VFGASGPAASISARRSMPAMCRSWRSPGRVWRPQNGGRLRDREPHAHRGLTIDVFKATGVSLRRDILAMEDAGARRDDLYGFGIVTTTAATARLARTMLTELAAGKPDVIVSSSATHSGTYGVDAILECADIRRALSAVLLSANDPVAAWAASNSCANASVSSPAP